LFNKFGTLQDLILKVQDTGENLIQRQTESEDFQKQMKKETEGYDLQRGVYRIIEALDGDRRELTRLCKKATEMKKRQSKGSFFDGENEELRSLILGANDLERKLHRALDELERLRLKTETLIEKQRFIDEQRRLKMEEEAKRNEASMLLLKDSELLDKLLRNLTEVKTKHMKAENMHRKIQELSRQFEDDEMDTDEIILERIGVDTQAATDDILRIRDDTQKIQDSVLEEPDPSVDIPSQANLLREKIEGAKKNVCQLNIDIDEFQLNQQKRYDVLMKKKLDDDAEKRKREEDDERRRKEEAERKRKEDEEERLRKLAEEELERERRRKEAELRAQEDKLTKEAEANRLKQKCEIVQLLEGDNLEVLKMKDKVLVLVDKQGKIGRIQQKRRELYIIPEDEEIREDEELNGLVDKTAKLYDALLANETEISRLKNATEQTDPNEVMKDMVLMENVLNLQSEQLENISVETDDVYKKHQLMLDEGLKKMSAEDAMKQKFLSNLEDYKDKIEMLKNGIKKIQTIQEEINYILPEARRSDQRDEEDMNKESTELKNLFDSTKTLNNSVLQNETDIQTINTDVKLKDTALLVSQLEEVAPIIDDNIKTLSSLKGISEDYLKKYKQKQMQGRENLMKQEFLNNLNQNNGMKIYALEEGIKSLRSTQEKIADIMKKIRSLVPMNETKIAGDEEEFNNLVHGTSQLNDSVIKIKDKVVAIHAEVASIDPDTLLNHIKSVESDTNTKLEILGMLEEETNNCLRKHQEMLMQGIKQREDLENANRQLQQDGDDLNKLKNDVQMVSAKQKDLELELNKLCDEDEEKRRRQAELEKLLKQQNDLSELERSLDDTALRFEEWKDFQWTPEEESIFQKYGMISSLTMPSFPLGLIKDPELLAVIQKRHAELLEIRKQLERDSMKMQEICEAIEEMEKRQREAELRRISEQSKEWIKDFVPSGPAEFGAEPVFRSDFHIDPEEARAAAASRKASRMQSRESSIPRLEEIGAAKGYEDILLGYTARSRQQSLDRRPGREDDRKKEDDRKQAKGEGSPTEHQGRDRKTKQESVKVEPDLVRMGEKVKKPPTAPRRKREK